MLALLMGALLFGLVNLLVALPVVVYEVVTGARSSERLAEGEIVVTPLLFAANNVAIALTVPIALLTMWACYGMRPRWLSSVVGGVRWGFLLRCLAACAVPYGLLLALELGQGVGEWRWQPWSLFMIGTIVLTTPFQAAGEEYGLRGLYNRAVAAWIPQRLTGALVGGLVSSLVFMALHGAGDLWLNLFYFGFGVTACRLAYRTGGLEAPVALHVVNNLASEVSLPFIDIGDIFNRSAGTASAVDIAPQVGVVLIAWALMELVARLSRVVQETAPGSAAATAS